VDIEPSFGVPNPLAIIKPNLRKAGKTAGQAVTGYAQSLYGKQDPFAKRHERSGVVSPKFVEAKIGENDHDGSGMKDATPESPWERTQRANWLKSHPGHNTPAELAQERASLLNEEVGKSERKFFKNAKLHGAVERVSGVKKVP
jgi:hypothetical protein